MSEERPTLTRRQILAGTAGLGAFGAVGGTGSGTAAYLTGDETVRSRLEAGLVDLDVTCEGCTVTDGTLAVAFDHLAPGTAGTRRLHLGVSDASNPVRLWLRTGCPDPADPLNAVLEVRLSAVYRCGSDDSERMFPLGSDWVSFGTFQRAFHDGERLDGPDDACLSAGDEVCLDFEYRLPEDATWAVGASAELRLELFAQQCRHVPEQRVEDPFPDDGCPAVTCPDCDALGKLDVTGDRLTPATTYDFDELYPPFDDDGHEYSLGVVTVTDKVGDDERETVCASLRLLRDGSERDAPPVCLVAVGGGRPRGTGPGGKPGKQSGGANQSDPASRRVYYDVDPPATRTRGSVCAAHDKDSPQSEPDGERPAISNLTVYVCTDGDTADDSGVTEDGPA